MTGRTWDADEALRVGFLNSIVAEDGDVSEAAHSLASSIAAQPRQATASAA